MLGEVASWLRQPCGDAVRASSGQPWGINEVAALGCYRGQARGARALGKQRGLTGALGDEGVVPR